MKAFYKIHRGETRLFVQFEYDEALINRIRAIEGRRYSQSEQSWHFGIDRTSWYSLIEIFPEIKQRLRPRFQPLQKGDGGPVQVKQLDRKSTRLNSSHQ